MSFEKLLVIMLCIAFIVAIVGCGENYVQAAKEKGVTKQLLVNNGTKGREPLQRQYEFKIILGDEYEKN